MLRGVVCVIIRGGDVGEVMMMASPYRVALWSWLLGDNCFGHWFWGRMIFMKRIKGINENNGLAVAMMSRNLRSVGRRSRAQSIDICRISTSLLWHLLQTKISVTIWNYLLFNASQKWGPCICSWPVSVLRRGLKTLHFTIWHARLLTSYPWSINALSRRTLTLVLDLCCWELSLGVFERYTSTLWCCCHLTIARTSTELDILKSIKRMNA